MAARKTTWTPDIVRQRIRVGAIITRFQKCALGELVLSKEELKAGEILLRKAVPDLRSVEHSGAITHTHVKEYSDAELAAIVAGSSEGTATAEIRAPEPDAVH